MRVIVSGSRTWDDYDTILERLSELPSDTVLLHGAARGADRLAGVAGLALGLEVIEVKADWKRWGRYAGFHRNLELLERMPDLVIAFWDGSSPGTRNMIEQARVREVPVEIHRWVDKKS